MTDSQVVTGIFWTMNDSWTWLAELLGHHGEWQTLYNANPGAWYDIHVPPIGMPINMPSGWTLPPTLSQAWIGQRLTQ